MTRIRCPKCQKNLIVKPELAGKVVACPGCQTKFRIRETPKEQEPEESLPPEPEEREPELPPSRRSYDDESPADDEPRPRRRKRKRRRSESSGSFLSEM